MNNQAAQTMPTVPQAFFDEFGVNADDRVMDYGRVCYAAALSQSAGVVEGLRAALHIETHKVITCGVAASHPDASLSRRMEYAGKWDSPQAQDVRKLRDRADAAERRVAQLERDIAGLLTPAFPATLTKAALEQALTQQRGALPSAETFASAVWRDWMTNEQADKPGAELRAWVSTHLTTPSDAGGEPVAQYTTGHCEYHKQPGGCQHHNLHCGWPNCDRRPK